MLPANTDNLYPVLAGHNPAYQGLNVFGANIQRHNELVLGLLLGIGGCLFGGTGSLGQYVPASIFNIFNSTKFRKHNQINYSTHASAATGKKQFPNLLIVCFG